MEYVMDPSLTPQPTMEMLMEPSPSPSPSVQVVEEPQVVQMMQQQPASFRLVLPFASFDRSTPTKLAGSILNLSALLTCLVWVYFIGRFGLLAEKTLVTGLIAMVFTFTTTMILSSGYKRKSY
jgi:hypothetical protein